MNKSFINRFFLSISILFIYGMLASCYSNTKNIDNEEQQHDALIEYSEEQIDSISFYSTHHYTDGYNFVVYKDSIMLIAQQPEEKVSEMPIDSFPVMKEHHVVVGDIRIVPQDSIDSVWVQLATDEGQWGWIHETELLPRVVPDDPISQFIIFFSDSHIIISLIILSLILIAYTARNIYRHGAPIVHLRDIPSFYPTLLCLIVATSATFYASIQMFGPDIWRHFYYHPSLNPFNMPWILSIFIASVWAMGIVAIAAIDDVHNQLHTTDAILYLCGMIGFCAIDYIIFSISTLYYIGYPLLIAYYWFAISRYIRNVRNNYICGHCGNRMHAKGRCPECGTINE